jgi:hypothetical protein
MVLIYMLACRSVGGSEGFVLADAMLFHARDSESVEVSGDYEKEHSGLNVLLAWGGGRCPYSNVDDGAPDGEGWKKSPDEVYTDEERCEMYSLLRPNAGTYIGGSMYRNSLNVYIEDGTGYDAGGNPGWNSSETTMGATVLECVRPTEAGVEYDYDIEELELDSANVKIHGDMGHITAKSGSKLVVNLTLPLCLFDYYYY